jgi:predicted acylesterase/phospholipase RssA
MSIQLEGQPIQLSLQGGGAKIVYLLALLEAVWNLEKGAKIKVVRLAGTSAGALSAGLYATRKPINEIKKLIESLAEKAIADFKIPTIFGLSWMAGFKGKPLWDEQKIRALLTKFFGSALELRHLQIPVKLVSSDLTTCDEHVHADDDKIVNSILDSCGIPIFFRNREAERVDGGLCSNLPVLQLRDNNADFLDAPIIAVTFPSAARSKPNSFKEFFLRLFDAGINNNVKTSKEGADFICEISVPPDEMIDTLDFEKANSFLKSNKFSDLVKDLEGELNKILLKVPEWHLLRNEIPKLREEVTVLRQEFERNESNAVAKLKKDLADSYGALNLIFEKHLAVRKKVKKIIWEIYAHSLEAPASPFKPDDMLVRQTLEATTTALPALKAMIQGPFESTRWKLYRSAQEEKETAISMSVFPVKINEKYSTVFLVPDVPIQINSGTHLLHMRDKCDALTDLRTRGIDEMFWIPTMLDGPISELILILHSPPNVSVIMTKKPVAECEAESENQLTDESIGLYRDHTPSGWSTCGWVARNVGEKGFGVNLAIVKSP